MLSPHDIGHWLHAHWANAPWRRHDATPHDDGIHVDFELLLVQRLRARALVLAQQRQSWHPISGLYRSGFRGRGLDFDEMRAYQPGDDIRHIDWQATARTGRAQTRLYREERERPVMLLLDLRASMHFGTRVAFKSVQAAKLAALIAWASLEIGDRVGGIVFTESRYAAIRPQAGRHGVLALLKQVASLHARAQPADEETISLATALQRLDSVTPGGALVHCISDFPDIEPAATERFARLARRCDVTGSVVFDPLEVELPEAGLLPLSDGEERRMIDAGDARVQRRHAQDFARQNQRVVELFTRNRAYLLRLATHNEPDESLRRLLTLRHGKATRAA